MKKGPGKVEFTNTHKAIQKERAREKRGEDNKIKIERERERKKILGRF